MMDRRGGIRREWDSARYIKGWTVIRVCVWNVAIASTGSQQGHVLEAVNNRVDATSTYIRSH